MNEIERQSLEELARSLLRRQTTRRGAIAGGLWLGGAALVASCSPFSSSSSTPAGKQSLIVLADAVANSFDRDGVGTTPGSQEANYSCAEPLLDYPATLSNGTYVPNFKITAQQFEPRLAQSWSSPDGINWTFKLRQGVKSAAGNEFTADDVVYTFARAKSVSGAAVNGWFVANVGGILPLAPILPNATAADKQLNGEVVKIDTYTVEFHLQSVSNFFPTVLTFWGLWIHDSKQMLAHATSDDPWSHNWNNTNIAGFGPYHITSWTAGQELVMAANPSYYRGLPQLKKITVRAIPESANRIAALRSGEADMVEYLAPSELKSLSGISNISVLGAYTNQVVDLFINYKNKPWGMPGNRELRQAVAYAIPYDDIVQQDFAGIYATRMYSLVPASFYGYKANMTYNTDLNKARSLMAQAGYANGQGLQQYSSSFQIFYASEHSALLEPLANRIRTNLAAIGMPVSLQPIPAAEFTTRQLVKKDMPMAITDFENAIIPDAGYTERVFYQSPSAGGLVNPQNYANPAFDALVTQSGTATGAARLQMLEQLQDILMLDLPAIPLVEKRAALPVRNPIADWYVRLDGDVPWYWYFKS